MKMNVFMNQKLKKKSNLMVQIINNKLIKNYKNFRNNILIQDLMHQLRKKKF